MRYTSGNAPKEGDIVHFARTIRGAGDTVGPIYTVEFSWHTVAWQSDGTSRLDRTFAYSEPSEAIAMSKALNPDYDFKKLEVEYAAAEAVA